MAKVYTIETKLVFVQEVEAKSKKEALDITRGTFADEYNLEPSDDEMKVIAEETIEE